MYNAFGGASVGGQTQTAGTLIQFCVQPRPGAFTRVTQVLYTDTGTAHTLTFLRPIGRTTTTAATAAAGTVINLTADPGTALSNAIAANDFLAIRETDGNVRFYKVSSVSSLAITLTAGLTVGCASGAKVWDFGITTDTGEDGVAHPKVLGGAGSSRVSYQDSDGGVMASLTTDDPILFNSNNATNAGTLNLMTWSYTSR